MKLWQVYWCEAETGKKYVHGTYKTQAGAYRAALGTAKYRGKYFCEVVTLEEISREKVTEDSTPDSYYDKEIW